MYLMISMFVNPNKVEINVFYINISPDFTICLYIISIDKVSESRGNIMFYLFMEIVHSIKLWV